MFNKITTKLKTTMQTIKINYGYTIFTFLLQCSLIALALLVVMLITGSLEITVWGIFEFILSIPVFSVIIALIRLALKCVHTLLPYGGILRLLIDIIVSVIVVATVGQYLPSLESNVLSTILLIGVDLLYLAVMVYFRNSPKSEA